MEHGTCRLWRESRHARARTGGGRCCASARERERVATVLLDHPPPFAAEPFARLSNVNQYEFIKNKSLQDSVAWAYEYRHLCHAFKQPIMVLKLDFKKAFDMFEHEIMLEI